MQQVSQGTLSFCLSMHVIICISRYVWGCACIHTLICKFLQDFKQKSQLCFFLEGIGEHQTNPTKWLFNQTGLNSILCSPLASLPTHPSLCTQILVSSTTAQIVSQQQEKCFLSVGILLGYEKSSILRQF